MPGNLQPLQNRIAIVNADGTPTEYFIRWAQNRQIDIQNGISVDQAKALIAEALAAIDIVGGSNITVTGSLANPPINISWEAELGDLSDVDVTTAPTNGQALVYDAASQTWKPGSVAGGGGGGGLYDISKGVPNPATLYGSPSSNFVWTQNDDLGLNVKYTVNAGLTRAIPGWRVPKPVAASWHVCALVLFTGGVANFYGAYIGVHNSANLRTTAAVAFSPTNQTFELQNWTNPTTRSSVVGSIWPSYKYEGPLWLHTKCDGTTISFGFSRDGANPVWGLTQTVAAWVGAGMDSIVFGLFAEPSGNVLNSNVSVLCYDDNADARVVGASGGTGGGGIPEAPIDGKTYGRKDAMWVEVPPDTPGPMPLYAGVPPAVMYFDDGHILTGDFYYAS